MRFISLTVLAIVVVGLLLLTHCVPAQDRLSLDATAGIVTADSTDLPAEAAHLSPEALWAINLALESEAGLDRVQAEDGTIEPVIITRAQLMPASEYDDDSMVAGLPLHTRIWVITLQGRWYRPNMEELGELEGSLGSEIFNLQVIINSDTAEKMGTVSGLLSPDGEFITPGDAMIDIHTTTAGQTLEQIASLYQISAESILMSNWDVLKGDPYHLVPGVDLLIPPGEGALYRWPGSQGELWMVAERFNLFTEHIWLWTGEEMGYRAYPAAGADAMELAPGALLFLQGVDLETYVQ
jgi:hypothetical protein